MVNRHNNYNNTSSRTRQSGAQWFSSCATAQWVVPFPVVLLYPDPLPYPCCLVFYCGLTLCYCCCCCCLGALTCERRIEAKLMLSSSPPVAFLPAWWDRPLLSGTLHPIPCSVILPSPFAYHHFAKKKYPPPFVGRGIWLQNTRKHPRLRPIKFSICFLWTSLRSFLIPAIDRQCVKLLMDVHNANVTNYSIFIFIFDLKCLLDDA